MSLREPTLFTLAALRDGPLHGYAIAARARELSGGRVTLTAGTLYGALDRLVEQGLVEVDREEVVDGRRRRYHRLTETGGHAVDEELDRLKATVLALSGATAVSPSRVAPGGRLGLAQEAGPTTPARWPSFWVQPVRPLGATGARR